MATTKYWTGGAGDGNFANLSNWSEATAFANDDVYIIGTTNQDISGLTHAFTGITLTVTEGYGGTLGSGGAVIFSSAASITYAGKGPLARFGCSGTVTTASMEHAQGIVSIESGTWTSLTNSFGRMDVAAAAVVTRLNNLRGGNVTVGYHATDMTNLYNAGLCLIKRDVVNVYALAGSTTQENSGVNYTQITTLLQVHNGARYNKKSSGADMAAQQGYVFPGGIYTTAGNAGGGVTTVDCGNLEIWGGASVTAVSIPGVTFDVSGFTYKGAAAPPPGLGG